MLILKLKLRHRSGKSSLIHIICTAKIGKRILKQISITKVVAAFPEFVL